MKNRLIKYCLIVLLVLNFGECLAQGINPNSIIGSNDILKLDHPEFGDDQPVSFDRAMFYLSLDLGEDYKLGEYNFTATVTLTLNAYDDVNNAIAGFVNVPITFELNNREPEQVFYKSFADVPMNIKLFEVSEVGVQVSSVPSSQQVNAYVNKNLRLLGKAEVSYAVDISDINDVTVNVDMAQNIVSERHNTFTWTYPDFIFPGYQIQVLRLYNQNNSISYSNNDSKVYTELDWTRALILDHYLTTQEMIDNDPVQVEIPLIEGTGFYVWRIRPLGSLTGGMTNPENFVAWEESDLLINNINDNVYSGDLNSDDIFGVHLAGVLSVPNNYTVLYLNDPDDDINWIYSRTFVEGGKFGESVNYADGLLNVRQSQSYNPAPDYLNSENDAIIINQVVLDRSGRPAVNSLPIPKVGLNTRISNYDAKAFRNINLTPYSLYDFDMPSNYTNEEHAIVTGGYYSGQTNNIAGSGGHPFSRTTIYNDGTGRVKEQSGVGADHTIGGNSTKYFYGLPTDIELAKIFGDEAPAANSVHKVVVLDPNNVPSISYINRAGQTIATCLADGNDVGAYANLEELSEENGIHVDEAFDIIGDNISQDYGVISSKKIVLPVPDEIQLSYAIGCDIYSALGCYDFDCRYNLSIRIVHMETNQEVFSCTGSIDQSNCASDINNIQVSDLVLLNYIEDDENVSSNIATISLGSGSYTIEKKLTAIDENNVAITSNEQINKMSADVISPEIYSISSLLSDWYIYSQENEDDFQAFFNVVDGLMNDQNFINTSFYLPGTSCSDYFSDDICTSGEVFFPGLEYMDLDGDSDYDVMEIEFLEGLPEHIVLQTTCCGELKVPINIPQEPDFSECHDPDNGLGFLFEGIEVPSFRCVLAKVANKENDPAWLNQKMRPYVGEEFNTVIFNMLDDEYITENDGDEGSHYDYEQLITCWMSTANMITVREAEGASENVGSNVNPVGEDPDNIDPDQQDDVDESNDNYDDNQPGQWLLNGILSLIDGGPELKDAMNDKSAEVGTEIDENLAIFLFLECTGLALEYRGNVSWNLDTPCGEFYLFESQWEAGGDAYGLPKFLPCKDFPFKYFIYAEGTKMNCEVEFCYTLDENVYQFGSLASDATLDILMPGCEHQDPDGLSGYQLWNQQQWSNFYFCVANNQTFTVADMYENANQSCNTLADIVYENELLDYQTAFEIINCMEGCIGREDEFEGALIDALEVACWEIEDCVSETSVPDFVMPTSHVELMTGELVGECQNQCRQGLTGSFSSYTLDQMNQNVIDYANNDVSELFSDAVNVLADYGTGNFNFYESNAGITFSSYTCQPDMNDCLQAGLIRAGGHLMSLRFEPPLNCPSYNDWYECQQPGDENCIEPDVNVENTEYQVTIPINEQ